MVRVCMTCGSVMGYRCERCAAYLPTQHCPTCQQSVSMEETHGYCAADLAKAKAELGVGDKVVPGDSKTLLDRERTPE